MTVVFANRSALRMFVGMARHVIHLIIAAALNAI
jgi:hypothetical protein